MNRGVLLNVTLKAMQLAELQKADSLADVPWTLGYLGYAYGISGKRRQGLKMLAALEKRSERSYVSSYAMALIHTGLGQKEQALRFVEKTFKERNQMPGFVRTSPELDSLHSHHIRGAPQPEPIIFDGSLITFYRKSYLRMAHCRQAS